MFHVSKIHFNDFQFGDIPICFYVLNTVKVIKILKVITHSVSW